jgi:hypothetical protein
MRKFFNMKLQTFYSAFIARSRTIISIVTILAICGTVVVLLGGVWDTTSHALRVPETFWTIQHLTIYMGASMITASAVMCGLLLFKTTNKKMEKGIKIILLGATMQLVGGYADYNFHEIYGIDGLVTSSHLTVESGLLLSSIGGLLTLSGFDYGHIRKMIPVSIVAVILSAAWIGFNLVLLLGAIVMCVPIYELFSSGCAVM